jgi:hypothetical protein
MKSMKMKMKSGPIDGARLRSPFATLRARFGSRDDRPEE